MLGEFVSGGAESDAYAHRWKDFTAAHVQRGTHFAMDAFGHVQRVAAAGHVFQ